MITSDDDDVVVDCLMAQLRRTVVREDSGEH